VEPLPKGTGFEFVNKIVGGSVRAVSAVEKGILAMQEGGHFTPHRRALTALPARTRSIRGVQDRGVASAEEGFRRTRYSSRS
jgi:hypothetical protein